MSPVPVASTEMTLFLSTHHAQFVLSKLYVDTTLLGMAVSVTVVVYHFGNETSRPRPSVMVLFICFS